MKKTIILILLIVTVFSLSLVRAVISNRISTSGLELSQIENNLNAYKSENLILKEKINDLSSLTHISTIAAGLGFTETKTSFTVSSARPIALRND